MRSLSKLTRAIRIAQAQHSILPGASRILIALSGGQDSTALTEALLALHRVSPWTALTAAHCDHGWELDVGNPDHVARYTTSRELALKILKPRHDIATNEAAAREWRYTVLADYAASIDCDVVVTGHTMTDVSETLLMGLSRGAVVPIPWVRDLNADIKLVRPLLRISRNVTRAVCEEQGIEIWEDAYNTDERFMRNRVRKHVIPMMRDQLNPRVETGLARVADVLREENEFIEEMSGRLHEAAVRYDGGVWIDGDMLRGAHRALRRKVVKRALADVDALRKCVYGQVETVCEVIEGRRAACVAGQREVRWIGDQVFIPAREEVGEKDSTDGVRGASASISW